MIELPRLALSIRQPWAWCILHAGKDIENRNWTTNFRGEFAIHAAKGMTQDEYDSGVDQCRHVKHRGLLPSEVTRFPAKHELLRGGIVGVATIENFVSASESPWFFGKYGFALKHIRPVDFIPVKGTLGFFDWRKNLEAQA